MFKDRQQAGQLLGKKIQEEIEILDIPPKSEEFSRTSKKLREEFIVLGIPRGGVVVAWEVAKILNCPLDVILVKKLGAPGQAELAIGAMGETNGSKYIDERLMSDLRISDDYLEEETVRKKEEIKKREQLYRQGREALDLKEKTVIIIDDGAATGATIIAAAREVWNNNPKKVIIALPVVAKDTLKKLEKEVDELVFLEAPLMFFAVGQFYQEFPQVSDETVMEILSKQ